MLVGNRNISFDHENVLIPTDLISPHFGQQRSLYIRRLCKEANWIEKVGQLLTLTVIGKEEERFVLHDWSAESSAELIDLKRWTLVWQSTLKLRCLQLRSLSVQRLIAEEFKRATMKFVGAGLGYDIYNRAPRTAEFSRESVLIDLKLLNRLF